ncbi:MAG: cadmium-translocating P-type ATPase [Candidatus Kerfeldbacteria bacterium]|nr:cadmium-translocating P-type ATPase [Candidatus Kerfeldbacteria bacterium]
MHPEIHKDQPGICPLCGMTLVMSHKTKPSEHNSEHSSDHNDFNKHTGHKTTSFLKKFWIALAATVPIFFYSEMAVMLFNIQAPQFPGSSYVFLVIGSFIFWYCGWVFLASAYRELRAKLPGMMTLISIAISAAYGFSFFSIVAGRGHDLLFELSSLITIMLLGHWIEMKSVQGAQGALKELAKLLPDKAEVIRGDKTEIIPLTELKVGDIVLVKPGANVPADGKISEGTSELNESVITGESRPVTKTIGALVIAGSINGDGSLKVVIEKIGEQTFLAGVMHLVANAQASKSRLQILSDRAAFYLTVIALVTGTITFITWLLIGAGVVTATERLVAVLVIACPHALGLAVPLVAAISTTLAARNGLLVKERRALEAARTIDTILFDKTGTLTKGEFGVVGTVSDSLLQFAASVNAQSEHPLAKAMVAAAGQKNLTLLPVQNFSRVAGKGVVGTIYGKVVQVGNFGTDATSPAAGQTVVQVVVDGKALGSIALADVIREESRQAIQTLHQLGIKTAMITGDSEDVAVWVAKELQIDEYFARVMPDQKSAKVKLLQSQGRKVAMVGDGVNDAPALTQADLGIAIGAGTNVAIESAGIILVRNDPRDIPRIIKLSNLTYQKMIQNLFWATGYNVVAIPLAAGVLAAKGIISEPALAAALMSVSTVIVALNAVLLRRRKLS